MLPKLYLYIDNFSFSDYYSSNSISCEAYMPNKKGSRTLARNTQNFLFLTHKKIDEKSRLDGISDQLTSWPVTLEFGFSTDMFDGYSVIFVKSCGEGYTLECGDLSEYDTSLHLGCYVYGELPFTAVTKILFDDECQMTDSDKSIFPDFLWQDALVDVLNPNDFSEAFILTVGDEELLSKMTVVASAQTMISDSNKYRAAILQLVNGTKTWQVGKYRTSFDSALQHFFEISTDTVKEILSAKQMPVQEELFSDSNEELVLIPTQFDNYALSCEQGTYNAIVRAFLANQAKCTPTVIHDLLKNIKAQMADISDEASASKFSEMLDAIEGCSLNTIGFTVDGVLSTIEKDFSEKSVLKALLFAIKNSAEYEKFVLSLDMYKADTITKRRAMILWGFLNGTRGIPSRGYNRDNMQLWANIEWKCAQLVNSNCKINKPANCADSPCGITITSEEIITFDEVHAFLSQYKLSKGFLQEIYTIAKNLDRKLAKEDPYCGYILTDENFYSKLPRLNIADGKLIKKSELDAFDKAYAKKYKELMGAIKKSAFLDCDAIRHDWIVCKPNFKKIWDVVEDRLKAFYVKQRG